MSEPAVLRPHTRPGRIGAGRKPTPRAPRDAVLTDLSPPSGLSDAARAYWIAWAPLAVRAGTLTELTRPGFIELCRLAADADRWAEQIDRDGPVLLEIIQRGDSRIERPKPHPLLTSVRAARKQVEMLQARFLLTATGRACVPPSSQPDDGAEILARLRGASTSAHA